MVDNCLETSILGRAAKSGCISFHSVNIRDYTLDKHKKVDDYTYGGGAGMLMQAQPVYDAWKSLQPTEAEDIILKQSDAKNPPKHIRTIYVTPQGKPLRRK